MSFKFVDKKATQNENGRGINLRGTTHFTEISFFSEDAQLMVRPKSFIEKSKKSFKEVHLEVRFIEFHLPHHRIPQL